MSKNTIRIIGGKWRGRRLMIPPVAAIRPTPNRVRETVFNWLAIDIVGATCLDAFAGSGALGFEALSRGALHVSFVDAAVQVTTQLQETAKMLQEDQIDIVRTLFPQHFHSNGKFNIVFLDPPFRKNLIQLSINFLQQRQLLQPQALIYLEAEAQLPTLDLPANWVQVKHKLAGEVSYSLYQAN